jgi:hypothetical protein
VTLKSLGEGLNQFGIHGVFPFLLVVVRVEDDYQRWQFEGVSNFLNVIAYQAHVMSLQPRTLHSLNPQRNAPWLKTLPFSPAPARWVFSSTAA